MRRGYGSWRLVRRLFTVMVGVYLGIELGYWYHGRPDSSPELERLDFTPRCPAISE